MAEERLLKVRAETKKRKPIYKRVQANQFAKLKNKGASWRKPKGMGNKVRRGRRGQASMPQIGYGSPKSVRGLNAQGLKEIIVNNVTEIQTIDSKTQIAVISASVGAKKKLAILEFARSKKLAISNVKDIDSSIKALTKEKKEVVKKVEKATKKATKSKEEKSE